MPEFAAVIDAYLRNARELLGTGNPPPPPTPGQSLPQPGAQQGWSGQAQQRAADQATEMNRMRHQTDNVKAQVHNEIAQSQAIGPRALAQLKAVETQWGTDRATLSAQRGTPEATAGLAQAGQHRVAEVRQIISSAAADYSRSAEAVHAARRQLPMAHVEPKQPPPSDANSRNPHPDPRPYECFLGSKGNDPAKVCGPIPAQHTYYIENGRFVQIEGGAPGPDAQVEISAGPGELMYMNSPDEPVVWLGGPPTPQDWEKWIKDNHSVNFRWQNPDGSIQVDRRCFADGRWQVIHQGPIRPGLQYGP